MPLFNDTWLDLLLSKNDIVQVVSSYVSLKPKGRRMWGLCPIHGEKTPSFSVSADKQMFYCFGCHAGGTVIQFIMAMEHMTYLEAVKFLAERVSLELPGEVDDAALQQERAKKERLYAACKAAAKLFYQQLLSEQGQTGREYLARRGLNAKTVARFGLGYALDSWDSLLTALQNEGFTEEELVECGLAVRNPKSGRVYDSYRNRILFPIIGTNGRVLGFGARLLEGDGPKYINTPDTPIYNKRYNLYALNLLKGAKIADIIIVEGYMDAISLHEAGVENAVASLGTALTQQQARLIKRYVPNVYICYDGDAAGQSATLRGLDILAAEGLTVRVIVVPDGLDPDEYVRTHGKDSFLALKDKAMTLSAFKLMRMADGFDLQAEDGREAYALAACKFIAGLQPVEQERCYITLARATGLPVETLKAQGAVSGGKPAAANSISVNAQRAMRNRENASERQRCEKLLLQAYLQAPDAVFPYFREYQALIEEPAYKAFVEALLEMQNNGAAPNAMLAMSGLESGYAQRIAELMTLSEDMGNSVLAAKDCIRKIQDLSMESELAALDLRLADDTLDGEAKLALMRQRQELENQRRELRGND